MKIKKYSKNENYTYTLGAFPTIEMINERPEDVIIILVDEKYYEKDNLIEILKDKNIKYEIAPNLIKKLQEKGNTYVIGVFRKYEENIINNNSHVALHNISDMGNLGTIIRTMVGLGVYDLALIGNTADIYNPKTIRASMGAFFKIRFSFFETMEDYISKYDNKIYLFMLSNDEKDSLEKTKVETPFTLVMGNEGAGLPKEFDKFGKKVFITQTKDIDSFNLPIATAIGLYEFRRKVDENYSI